MSDATDQSIPLLVLVPAVVFVHIHSLPGCKQRTASANLLQCCAFVWQLQIHGCRHRITYT
jgi:hypothetical protein